MENREGDEERDQPSADDQDPVEQAQPPVLFAPVLDLLSFGHASRVIDTRRLGDAGGRFA
jgi:hypothetical protein